MAEGFWEEFSKQEHSSLEFGFELPTGDFNLGSEDNVDNGVAKTRSWDEGGSTDTDKADEELLVEGGPPVTRRPRGRPLGSRNKPKGPLHGIHEIPNPMRNCILEVPGGFNIPDILESFITSCDLAVFVMSARGNVTNVNFRESLALGGIVDNRGPFEIISLTGAFPRGVPTQGGTGLKVTLTDAQGGHVGGTVVSLVAYGTVFITVGTINNINRDVLDAQDLGLLHSPAPVTARQHFQPCTVMTVQRQIGLQSPSPTVMTVQQQIGMVPVNNAILNSAIGSVRPDSHEVMDSVMPNLAIGSVRLNSQDPINNVTPNMAIASLNPGDPELMSNVMPNLGIGSVARNSQEPINHVMSNLEICSVTPNSHDMISSQPQHSWF